MTRAWLAALGVLWASTTAAQTPVQLTLDEALALAVQHNRSLASADMEAQKAEQDLETARSWRFPQFKLEAQASQLLQPIDIHFPEGAFGVPGETTITTPARMSGMINTQIAQPLTQLFSINLGVRMSEVEREVRREDVRNGRLEIVNQVKQLYYGILQTESAIGAADHAITLLREVNRTVNERLVRQVVLKNDALDVDARLAEAEHARLRLRNALATQKEQLNQLLGRDVLTPFTTAGVPPPTTSEVDVAAARSEALEGRPDIRQARLRLQQAELGVRIARTEYIPDVSLAVSYLSPLNVDGAPRQIATAGLQLQWEPFDWGRRGRAVAAKEIEVRQARNALRDTEDRVVLEINAAHRKLDEARSQLRVATITKDAAQEAARVRTTQFQAQAVLLSDVLQAESGLADASNDYQQALLTLWQARAEYEHALGQDAGQ
jgi:outer membrane protein